MVHLLVGLDLARGAFGQRRPQRLEERHVVSDAGRLLVRDGEGERLRELTHDGDEALLAVLLSEHMLLGGGQQLQPLSRAAGPRRPVEAVEDAAADLVLLDHQRNSLVLVDGRAAVAAALRVRREGLLELVRESEVVDHQAAGLVLEHAIDAGDRLHQAVAAHRLVDVHRVEARRVEPGQPHVAHEDDLQRVVRVAEALGEGLAAWLVADVRLPVRRVRGGAGHHHLDRALVVVGVLPLGA